jgi:hypothetical protein
MGIEEEVKCAKATLQRIRGSQERRDRHEVEDEERRSPTAYFHIAEAYFIGARRLRSFEPHGHGDHQFVGRTTRRLSCISRPTSDGMDFRPSPWRSMRWAIAIAASLRGARRSA